MNKRPVIIDCDPGHDDAIALLIALASDEIDVKGITTVAGNHTVDKTTNNTLKILELCQLTNVPVAVGRHNPLMSEIRVAEDVHGVSGMDGPIMPNPSMATVSQTAVEFMARVVEESEMPVSLVAVGPFTNVATFLLAYPHLHSKIECISVMGGGVWEGNRTALAEFNIWNDPEAAKVVMSSGIPVMLHGLDVTHKAVILKEEFQLFRDEPGPIFQFVADLLDFYARAYVNVRKLPGCPMHDSCAVASLIAPDMFERKAAHLDMDIDGGKTRGAVIVDIRPEPRRLGPNNGYVYLDVDRERFFQLVMDSCRTLESKLIQGGTRA